MPLTDIAIRNAKTPEKPTKLSDTGGLFLFLKPNGSKLWRLKYRVNGTEKLLSLGIYPTLSLKDAREKRDEARRLIAAGRDPSAEKRMERLSRETLFQTVANEWLRLQAQRLGQRTYIKKKARMEDFVLPYLGKRPIVEIKAPDVLAVLKRLEERKIHETAHRVRSECGAVFRFAIATGLLEIDPTLALRGALLPVVVQNRPSITDPKRIGELLRAIEGYRGHLPTEYAFRMLPYVFVRPGELRLAEWSEFDFADALWRIPAGRMKMREQHLVPLSTQVLKLLVELKPHTGDGRLVFPSTNSDDRAISDNTLNAALRRIGYTGDQIVSHGFRSMASTLLNEQGWHPDLIELQLAHAERNEVRSAYNRAQRLPERRNMMQAWADHLCKLKDSAG